MSRIEGFSDLINALSASTFHLLSNTLKFQETLFIIYLLRVWYFLLLELSSTGAFLDFERYVWNLPQ